MNQVYDGQLLTQFVATTGRKLETLSPTERYLLDELVFLRTQLLMQNDVETAYGDGLDLLGAKVQLLRMGTNLGPETDSRFRERIREEINRRL